MCASWSDIQGVTFTFVTLSSLFTDRLAIKGYSTLKSKEIIKTQNITNQALDYNTGHDIKTGCEVTRDL